MGATREYWECARECARLAAETPDREAKNHLLDMAQAWTELALLEAGVVSFRQHLGLPNGLTPAECSA